ncbi:hypothetical protein N7478_004648 [Penicillium angulare]|uniref:uncharacterized protein n=1 Tax=Penicillium angulare TaxID=116970 RepID=UPI002540B057|nr:uncharacterized protein N7478_004648 [Penicillium angulare]KAJ5279276.1 hypothetical protein N7478_004648 [Penicillium angulare]
MANTYQSTDPTPGQIQLASMPQLAEAINKEDDWTGIKDAAARRRAQTRLNTRAYHKYKIIESNNIVGKRKALAKKAEGFNDTAGTLVKSEALVECWDIEKQSISVVPAARAKKLYNARNPLLREVSSKERYRGFIFPLCPDHLITLLQFNALRAMAANSSLVRGKVVTPLDCEEELIHLTPYPTNPERLPLALLPTTLQQTVPHGNWIDMWPSPEGRDRLIRASGTYDEEDLWEDCFGGLYEGFPDDEVMRRGMIAWSPPWDITGWEMSEGFLEKWGWLIAGIPGVLEATNKWRMKRGEEPLNLEFCTSRIVPI